MLIAQAVCIGIKPIAVSLVPYFPKNPINYFSRLNFTTSVFYLSAGFPTLRFLPVLVVKLKTLTKVLY